MLHVLLLILKITGIVIACILGLAILVVAAVLFVPVRYKADADYHGSFKAHAKVSWLGIIRGLVSYDEELAIRAKVLFFTIYNNNEKTEKTSKHKKSEKKKSEQPEEENIFSVSDEEAKKLTEKEEKPQIKMAEAVNENKEDVQAVKDNVEDIKESAEALKETMSEETSQNKNLFDKVKDKCFVIYARIKDIIKLIKDTVKKVSGAADKLKEKVVRAKEFVTDEDNKELFHFLVEQLKAFIKIIRPKKYRVNAKVGFEDPATMGKVLAYVSILYGISGADLSLEPVFGEDVKEGSVFLKGSIQVFPVLVIALRVYRNEQFKKLISR